MAGLFGLLNSFAGSPIGGQLLNAAYFGPRARKQYDEFLQNQRNVLAERQAVLGGLGGVQGDLSRLQGQLGNVAASAFGGQQTLNRFNNAGFQQAEGLFGAVPGQFGQASNEALTRFGAGQALLNRRYGEQLSRARGLVGQISDQERQDINRRADERIATATGNLRARGFGGGTIAPTVTAGLNRERDESLRRESDQRLMRQLGVESEFGGAALGAQERGLGLGANLRLGAASQAGQFGLASAGALGNIAGQRFGAQQQAGINRFNSLLQRGMLGPEFQLQQAGLALGSLPQFMPPQYPFGQVQPRFQG